MTLFPSTTLFRSTITVTPENAKAGDTVTIMVTPDDNYLLKADSLKVNDGAVAINGTANPYIFTMPASDVTVTAEFEELPAGQHSVTIDTLTHGGIGTNKTSAAEGDTITLTVTPDAGYQYTEGSLTVTKTGGGTPVDVNGAGNTYTFTMPDTHVTVTATFTAISYTISITDPGNGNSVSADPSDSATVGTPVTLTVTPATGYALQSISYTPDDGNPVPLSAPYTFTMPASNVTVTAQFEELPPDIYSVTIADGIDNGTVSANPSSAPEGTYIAITVNPANNYRLVANSLTYTPQGGSAIPVTGSGPYTFAMPAANVTVQAQFEPIPTYSVTTSGISNGTVTASPTSAPEGTAITLTVNPENDYQLVANSLTYTPQGGSAMPVSGTGPYTFVMPAANVTIQARFVEAEEELTAGLYQVNGNYLTEITVSGDKTLVNMMAAIKASAASNNAEYVIVLGANEVVSLSDGYRIGKNTNANATETGTNHTHLTITLKGTSSNITISRNTKGPLFNIVGNDANDIPCLILENITLAGYDQNNCQLIIIGNVSSTKQGALIMKDGSLITGNSNSGSSKPGAAVCVTNGEFTMEGGSIEGNTSTASSSTKNIAGGVYVDSKGTFTMKGGTIKGNSAKSGSAVYIEGGIFIKNDTMDNNSGTIYGGAGGDANAIASGGTGHVIEIKNGNWRDSTAGPTVNTADGSFWEN
jgi:hypothetical protein